MDNDFSPDEQESFYRLIAARRDIRRFRSDPIPGDILDRILWAAHRAGSVGFMQPWNFILVRDIDVRRRIKDLFEAANASAASTFEGDRQDLYRSLKLEGILESPLNICVTCNRHRGGPHVLGRHTMPETDLYSTCTAIQNLWLAARVEGVGVGWVSILDNVQLAQLLNIPDGVTPVAYLCVGYPVEFPPVPELQTLGWRDRLDLANLVFEDKWKSLPGENE